MDTDDSVSSNVELEAEYLSLFGTSLSHCVEELLEISTMIARARKEDGETTSQILAAIEHAGLQSKVQ